MPVAGVPLDAETVLAAVEALPIATWRYRGSRELHVGPMAQDWAAGLGLGGDVRRIAVVDALGVALVYLQVLARRVRALETAAHSGP